MGTPRARGQGDPGAGSGSARGRLRGLVAATPLLGPLARLLLRVLRRAAFPGSSAYWEARYAGGGTSGPGSHDEPARRKAVVLNRFVKDHGVRSVVEFGCGDGAQLSLAEYPRYLGLDVSRTAVELCRKRFQGDSSKEFHLLDPKSPPSGDSPFKGDLALSLDVVYHLVEDDVFERYMRQLFGAAEKFVIIYSTDEDAGFGAPHVRHRAFRRWVEREIQGWGLLEKLPVEGPPRRDPPEAPPVEFFVYGKV